ncbi:MAG: FecR domain-containing protein [Magnetococcales bacterium]|nr:FecR domain-containing protein [Magnetococcales bacterium]
MSRVRSALFFGLSLLLAGSVAADSEVIGNIKSVKGNATIHRAGGQEAAALGGPIYMNDTLKTGADGAVGVTFVDNTMVTIGADTEYVIDTFAYQPAQNQLGFASRLTKGSLQFVSGNMAKLKPESVSVNTPVGTIGVRGTRFLIKIDE